MHRYIYDVTSEKIIILQLRQKNSRARRVWVYTRQRRLEVLRIDATKRRLYYYYYCHDDIVVWRLSNFFNL